MVSLGGGRSIVQLMYSSSSKVYTLCTVSEGVSKGVSKSLLLTAKGSLDDDDDGVTELRSACLERLNGGEQREVM
jgi:hypothetical protein